MHNNQLYENIMCYIKRHKISQTNFNCILLDVNFMVIRYFHIVKYRMKTIYVTTIYI